MNKLINTDELENEIKALMKYFKRRKFDHVSAIIVMTWALYYMNASATLAMRNDSNEEKKI